MQNTVRIPEQGDDRSIIARLEKYISQFDPKWRRKTEPSSPQQIEKYRKLSRIGENEADFPLSYLTFLEEIGKNNGGIFRSMKVEAEIDKVLSIYEDFSRFGPDSIDPQALMIGNVIMGPQISISLRRKDRYHVVKSDSKTYFNPLSDSFEKFLFQAAFSNFEEKNALYTRIFSSSEDSLERAIKKQGVYNPLDIVRRHAAAHNFTEIWPSDRHHYLAYRDDVSLYVKTDAAIFFKVMGSDDSFIRKFVNPLARDLGARDVKVNR